MTQSVKIPDAPKQVRPVPAVAIHPAIASSPTKFQKFMDVLSGLEPVVLAGVSPFVKNPATGAIVAAEAPIAQAFLAALSKL